MRSIAELESKLNEYLDLLDVMRETAAKEEDLAYLQGKIRGLEIALDK